VQRIDNQTIKRYDPAKTPYQRVLERKDISLEAEARLANIYVRLNPAELRRRIDKKNRQSSENFSATFWLDATFPPK